MYSSRPLHGECSQRHVSSSAFLQLSPRGPHATTQDPSHSRYLWDLCSLFSIKAGCAALPPLLTIKQVMLQRQCSGVWSAKDELPVSTLSSHYPGCPYTWWSFTMLLMSDSLSQVEIDIGVDCRFHSIFACPILKQQSNDANPPVRLICGHVISKDALQKLASGNK